MKRDIGHIDNNSGQGAEYLRATGGPVRKSIWIYRARDKTLTDPDGEVVVYGNGQPHRFASLRECRWWLGRLRCG